MTDLLAHGATWLADQRKRFLTRTVTYQRTSGGVTTSVDLPATVGRTVFRFDSAYGPSIRSVSRDVLITAADLVLDGQLTEPKRGDRIRETAGPVIHVHEVMGPGGASGGDEPDWRYSDNERTTFRIHTKHVNEEPNP